MKGFNFSQRKFLMLKEYSFNSTTKSTFHWLLRGSKSVEDESKSKTSEKKKKAKTPIANVLQSSDEQKKNSKKVKSLTIGTSINDHDMQIKIKQVQKFMDKGLTVALRVGKLSDEKESVDKLFSRVQKSVTEQQIPARLTLTGPVINIIPVITKSTEEEKENNTSSDLNLKSKDES